MAQNGGIQYINRKESWYFTKEELSRTPSTKHMDKSKELAARQHAASFIQDMGLRLKVSQVIINTSVVYMHRFYMHHSFKVYNRNHIATACIFLACKIEEQPIRIYEIVKVFLLSKGQSVLDRKSPDYLQLEERIKNNEILLLQTLGFEVAIDHPHHYLLKCAELMKITRDIAKISYFMAHNSLLLTTMCLEYKPQTVACVCINLSCKWKNIIIPLSSENKDWWNYIDPNLTQDELTKLTYEFIGIIGSCPSRLKIRIEEYCKNRTASSVPPTPPNSTPSSFSTVVQSSTRSSGLPDAKRVRYSGQETADTTTPDKHYSNSQPRIYPHAALSNPNSGYQHPSHQGSVPPSKRDSANQMKEHDYRQERQKKDTQQQRHSMSSYKIPHRDDTKRI